MLQDMNEKNSRGFHSLNIMLLSCTSMIIYSLLFFTPVDYVKSSVLMLGSVLKLIVFILHVLIKLNYMSTTTMHFKMQLEQGLRKMHRDWGVKSFSIHSFPAFLDIWSRYIKMQWLYTDIMIDSISLSRSSVIRNEMRSLQIFPLASVQPIIPKLSPKFSISS